MSFVFHVLSFYVAVIKMAMFVSTSLLKALVK
jgi:hypothetical protein